MGPRPGVTYVSDIQEAVRRAKEAAGDKNVLVHGVGTAQRSLPAGLLDEIQIHLVPVLLGEGRRLFEHLGADHIELWSPRILRRFAHAEAGRTSRSTHPGSPQTPR
jgi:dihydrofolate reductase